MIQNLQKKLRTWPWGYFAFPTVFIYAEYRIIAIARGHRPPTQIANEQFKDFMNVISSQFEFNRNLGLAFMLMTVVIALTNTQITLGQRLLRAVLAILVLIYYMIPTYSH